MEQKEFEKLRKRALDSHGGKPPKNQKGDTNDEWEWEEEREDNSGEEQK